MLSKSTIGFRTSTLNMSIVLIAGIAATALPAFAGPVYLSQARSLAVQSSGGEAPHDEAQTLEFDFGLFDETVEVSEAPSGVNGPTTFAKATQRSELGFSGFSLVQSVLVETTGTATGNISATARSIFDVTFRLDAPHTFEIDTFFDFDEQGFDAEFQESIHFAKSGGPTLDWVDGTTGELSPGVYSFFSSLYALSVEDAVASGTFNFDLKLTPVDGNTPPVIPLPPAVWGGLLMLGGVAARRALPAVWSRGRNA